MERNPRKIRELVVSLFLSSPCTYDSCHVKILPIHKSILISLHFSSLQALAMIITTEERPQGPFCAFRSLQHSPKESSHKDIEIENPFHMEDLSAPEWADLLKDGFHSLHQPDSSAIAMHVLQYGLSAPRRKHVDEQSSRLAFEIASLLYPAPSDAGVSQVIKYGESYT